MPRVMRRPGDAGAVSSSLLSPLAAGSNGVLRVAEVGDRREGAVQDASGGMGRDGSTCQMGRLKAPARDEPGIDQHQRRALRQYLREIGSDIKQCNAAGWLRVTKPFLNRSAVIESGAVRNPS